MYIQESSPCLLFMETESLNFLPGKVSKEIGRLDGSTEMVKSFTLRGKFIMEKFLILKKMEKDICIFKTGTNM